MSGHSWSGDRTYAAQQQPEPQRRECRSLNLLGHQRTPKIRFFPTSNHCRLPIMFAGPLLHHLTYHRSILRALMLQWGMQPFRGSRGLTERREEARAEGINRNPLGNSASTAIRAVGIHQESQMSLPTQASSEAGPRAEVFPQCDPTNRIQIRPRRPPNAHCSTVLIF